MDAARSSESQKLPDCGRFEVIERVAQGGMGAVYRARDRSTDRTVAVKLIEGPPGDEESRRRFAREAALLATVRHPQIVEYIDHGTTTDGHPFLAMEWLEGEDLSHRLAREGLTSRQSLTVVKCIAEALVVAHAKGVVHRDIKPSNVFLRGGRYDDAVLLDFGLARPAAQHTHTLGTRSGVIVGTPSYMAPEQARGLRQLTPAVDTYGLGCLLFRCLAGRPPFEAGEFLAVLTMILFGDAPDLRRVRPAVPEGICALVRHTLAKDPEQRPHDAAVLLAQLEPLLGLPELPPPSDADAEAAPSFGEGEQQLATVIVATPPESADGDNGLATLRGTLTGFGARGEKMADGSLVASFHADGRSAATDQVAQAVRAAFTLRESWPNAAIAIATGRSEVGQRRTLGDAVDRAVALLRDGGFASHGVVVDEVTAGLLRGRYQTEACAGPAGGHLIRGSQTRPDELRLLLGKPTPCVGREQELAMLDGVVHRCAEESESAAVIVLAPAGAGKSRLRHELLRRFATRGGELEVLVGCADVNVQAVPYALFRDLLLPPSFGLAGHDAAEQRRRLMDRTASTRDPVRVAMFLGELAGLRLPDEGVERVVLARQDPRRMSEEIACAVVELIEAQCAQRPTALILEDLHWADAQSLRLLGRVIRELRARPLAVVAFARPDLDEGLVDLWPGCTRVNLRALSKKASEQLARAILGEDASASEVHRIVEHAAGNALYLEELIRAAAEGRSERLPETVLAMLQSRIARLPPQVRRVLRACSVFGETVPQAGVAAVLGTEQVGAALTASLDALVEAEILEPGRDLMEKRASRGSSYAFRHALMRDAAYTLLTDADRREAHRCAAQYFEELADCEPILLAEHYKSAGDQTRALTAYLRAGDAGKRIGALAEARATLSAAYALFASAGDDLETRRTKVDVLLQQAKIGLTADHPTQNLKRMDEARALLEGIPADNDAAAREADVRRLTTIELICAHVHVYLGQSPQVIAHARRARALASEIADDHLITLATVAEGDIHYADGRVSESFPFLQQGFAGAAQLDNEYDRVRAIGYYAMVLVAKGDVTGGLALHQAAVDQATASGSASGHTVALTMRALSEHLMRDSRSVLATAESMLAYAKASGERFLLFIAYGLVGWNKALLGDTKEGSELLAASREIAEQLGGRLLYDDALAAAEAQIALYEGDHARALALASTLAPRLLGEGRLVGGLLAKGVWGLALARAAPIDEAAFHINEALRLLDSIDALIFGAVLRLEWAHACKARGWRTEAEAARGKAVAVFSAGGRPDLVASIEATFPKLTAKS